MYLVQSINFARARCRAVRAVLAELESYVDRELREFGIARGGQEISMSITGQPGGTSARLAAIPHRDCGHIGAQAGRIWPAAIAGLLGSARRGVARALAAVASALAAVGLPPRIAPADLGRPEVNRTRGDLGNRSERASSAALRFGVSPNPDVAAAADARAALVRGSISR